MTDNKTNINNPLLDSIYQTNMLIGEKFKQAFSFPQSEAFAQIPKAPFAEIGIHMQKIASIYNSINNVFTNPFANIATEQRNILSKIASNCTVISKLISPISTMEFPNFYLKLPIINNEFSIFLSQYPNHINQYKNSIIALKKHYISKIGFQ